MPILIIPIIACLMDMAGAVPAIPLHHHHHQEVKRPMLSYPLESGTDVIYLVVPFRG
jgi:hypothetical protein